MIEVVNSQDCDGFNKRMRLRGLTVKPPKEAKAKAKGVTLPKGARTGPKRPLGWSGWSRSTPDHQQQQHQALPPLPTHTIPGSVGKLGAREPEAKKMRWNKCLAVQGDRKACLYVVLHVSGLLSGGAMAGGRRGKARGGEAMRAREKGLKVGE